MLKKTVKTCLFLLGIACLFYSSPNKSFSADAWYSGGYKFRKKITIDNTLVSGSSNLLNFPILVSYTDNDLRTTANGGWVTNSNGYDIIFTDADSTNPTKLAHEIESYNASTGTIVMWVQIPVLDYNDDTDFYIYYGNSSISTSQDGATGAGQARTISLWLNITTGADNKLISDKSEFNGDHLWLQTQGTGGDTIGGVSAAGSYLDTDPVPGTGSWKHIAMTYDGSADDWGGAENRVNQHFKFADSAGSDYHLSGRDRAAVDKGENLSTDGVNPFSTDIDGEYKAREYQLGHSADKVSMLPIAGSVFIIK